MPSNENNTPDKTTEKETNVTKFEATKAAKPKKKLSFGWWLGMIVLILIAITFVLPTGALFTGNTNTDIVFGKYGKENITFAYNNYFHQQYQNIASQYSSSGQSGTQAAYQIWWSAYQNTVFHTALGQMAGKAGIIAAPDAVNRAIIESGVYNKDGKFDTATYNAASAESKAQIKQQITESLPSSIVMNDISTVLSSQAEMDYVGNMAASTRTFDYVMFGTDSYPDDLAIQYAMNDPQPFVELGISMFSLSDEETAKQVAADIAAGTISFDDASAQYDVGSALSDEVASYYMIAMNFANQDEVNQLFSEQPGAVVGPYANPYGYYSIYRVDSAPTSPDFGNPNSVLAVKQYLALNQSETISAYAQERATAFAEAAKADFTAAMDEFSTEVSAVSATPANIGNSTYMGSFSNSDPNQGLANAATDKNVMRSLFTEPVGTVVGPFKSGSNYVVAEVTGEQTSSGTANYVTMFYDYIARNQNQQDLIQAVFSSDDFHDDFMNVFFSKILGYN